MRFRRASLRLALAMVVSALTAFGAVLAAGAAVNGPVARTPGPPPGVRAGAHEDAISFARRVVRLIAENRYDQAWPLLHPSHRLVVTRSEYVTCERQSPIPGRLVAVRTRAPVDEPVVLRPGERVPSRAVPVQVVLLDLATSEQTVVDVRVHAVSVDGRWRWVLPPERLARYRAGICPDAPPARYD
jgi:hypothetical protein